jgi:O-antigen/teichoic acid export membrane protein
MGSSTRAALSLMVGRTIGFAVAFVIPLLLVRALSQQEFGIYKYLFLLIATFGALQFGMAESLYYFVPRFPDAAGRAIANAIATLVVIGAVVAVVAVLGAHAIAQWTGNLTIEPYLPFVGVFLALTLISAPLEIVMVARKAYRRAAVTYALADAVRACALVLPGVLFRDLKALLAGAIVYGVLRVALLITYTLREFRGQWRLDSALWKTQLGYALPFSAAIFVEVAQINLHQYVVWARFDPATFAIYAAGCLQIPLVDLLTMSVANVMMVRMSEELAEGRRVIRLWHDAVERLAVVLVPLALALALTSYDVMVLLFTPAYAASAPIFAISTGAIVLAALPVDAMLRVWAQTRLLIVMNLIRLAVVIATISWAIGTFSLPGAMFVTIAGLVVSKSFAVTRIARLLQVPIANVLPWRPLGAIVAIALVSLVPAVWIHARLTLPPIGRGAATACVYGAAYLAITAASRASWRAEVGRRLGWLAASGGR